MKMRYVLLSTALHASAASAQNVTITPEQIKQGGDVYAQHCATCHGNRMKNPEWAIDLATLPKNDRQRFIQSVTHGKNSMPPWGDVLKPNEIEALYAYFSQGEQ